MTRRLRSSSIARTAPAPFARRGAAYLIFLASALMVTVLGLTAVAARRIEARRSAVGADATAARMLARSAIELGLTLLNQDSQWRQSLAARGWTVELDVAGGTTRIQLLDPVDGDVADSDDDPVVLRGTGRYNSATQVMAVTLSPQISAVDVLTAALHSDAGATVAGGKTVTLTGGPMWLAGSLDNSGVISGKVEAQSVSGPGVIVGSVTKPTAHSDVSMSAVWDSYAEKAVTLPYASEYRGTVLGPGYNPWGSASADGVYLVTTSNRDLRIRETRLYGTLLVDAGTKKVTLDSTALLHPARTDYPVLLVKGDLELRLRSSDSLTESSAGVNLNRSGVPYNGVTDNDKNDTYPNRIEGLVYVTGTITFKDATRLIGTVLADGDVSFEANARLDHDAALVDNPPQGFYSAVLSVQQGSWTRIVD
jgi:Tfp pilus assembly protein PilX